MIKKLSILALLVVVILVLAIPLPVSAAHKPKPQAHQVLAGLWIKQGTREASLDLSTVDHGAFAHISARQIAQGIRIYDDAGRSITFKAKAIQTANYKYAQGFRLTGFTLINRGTAIRVTHIDLGIFTGSDWSHPYETSTCGSPSWPIDHCLTIWKASLK